MSPLLLLSKAKRVLLRAQPVRYGIFRIHVALYILLISVYSYRDVRRQVMEVLDIVNIPPGQDLEYRQRARDNEKEAETVIDQAIERWWSKHSKRSADR